MNNPWKMLNKMVDTHPRVVNGAGYGKVVGINPLGTIAVLHENPRLIRHYYIEDLMIEEIIETVLDWSESLWQRAKNKFNFGNTIH